MTAIGPGTLLICIKPAGYSLAPEAELKVGAVYTCDEVVSDAPTCCPTDGCGHTGLKLAERRDDIVVRLPLARLEVVMPSALYCPNIFRPLNDGDSALVVDEADLNPYDQPAPTLVPA